jgi:hypothetical protein
MTTKHCEKIAKIITLFINGHVKNKPQDLQELKQVLNKSNPLIHFSQNK